MKPWEEDWSGVKPDGDVKPWELNYATKGKPAMEHTEYRRIPPVQRSGNPLDFLRGLGQGLEDPVRGIEQRAAEVRSIVNKSVIPERDRLYAEEESRRERREFDPDVTKAEKVGQGVGRFGMTLPFAFATGGQTAMGSTLISILAGGAGASTWPTTSPRETMANIGTSAVGQGAGNLFGRFVMPNTARQLTQAQKDILAAAQSERVPLRTGEATGSNVIKNWETMRANRPLTGGMAQRFSNEQTEAINRAFTRRLGVDSKGASREVGELSDDILLGLRDDIGSEVSGIVKGKDVPLDNEFFLSVMDVHKKSNVGGKLTSSAAIREKINDAFDLIIHQPKVKGEVAQEIRSNLLDQARDARLAGNNGLANGLQKLANGVRDAMGGTLNAEQRARWAEANRQYSNYKLIEDAFALNKKALAEGDVPIEKMATAMERSTPLSYIHGKGEFSDLAKLGQVIRQPRANALIGAQGTPFVKQVGDVGWAAAYPVLESQFIQRYLTGGLPGQKFIRDIPGGANTLDALLRSSGLTMFADEDNFR
jgi:hypothetical protein